MTDASLKLKITDDMKNAMREHDKARLNVIRLILAALKQKEVDERLTLCDGDIIGILDKMLKQRRESIKQYEAAKRDDLAKQEQFEIEIISAYLPQALSESEVNAIIDAAVAESGAAGIKDMGKVMNLVKPKVQGRTDMGLVSQAIKTRLS